MVLSNAGPISFSQIRTEFGGGVMISISQYYQNAPAQYTLTSIGIPDSGPPLSFSTFRGKVKTANYTNLVCFLDAVNPRSYSGSGTTWTDLSTSANSVTLNTCGFSSSGGGAITFNGTSSYAYRQTFSNFNSGNWTCIAWIYATGNFLTGGYGGMIISLGRSPSDADTEMLYYLNGMWDYQGGIGFNHIKATTAINSTNWYQIAFVKNGTSGQFYLNGASNGSATAALNASYSTNDFCIGKDYRDNINFYLGYISMLMIYNYSMTSSEINTNFTNYRSRYGV